MVSAADAAGALAAGSIAGFIIHVLNLGNPPSKTWAPLPGFVVLCALGKLLAAPCVLLLLRLRERVLLRGVGADGSGHSPLCA